MFVNTGNEFCLYNDAPVNWMRAHTFIPYFCSERDGEIVSRHLKRLFFNTEIEKECGCAVINSTLFFLWWITHSSCYNVNSPEIFSFKLGLNNKEASTLSEKNAKLTKDVLGKSRRRVYVYKSTGRVEYDEFYMKLSKPIIDEIDKVLAKHYGFTEEELDFIINYDIKYRMGDELMEQGEQSRTCSNYAESRKKSKEIQLDEESNSESQPEKPQTAKPRQKPVEQKAEPKDNTLTMIVGKETIERIKSGEKTTFKRYLDDEEFAKEVLVTENGRIKLSNDHCPYTAKDISSIKLVCDGNSLVKPVTKISFRTGTNQQGKTAWKIVFHF